MADAEHVADFVDAVAGCVDHFFAANVAFQRVHDKFAVGLARNAVDRIETINIGTGFACLARHGKGDARGIDVAIERIPPGA